MRAPHLREENLRTMKTLLYHPCALKLETYTLTLTFTENYSQTVLLSYLRG